MVTLDTFLTMTHNRILFFSLTLFFVLGTIAIAREWTATSGHTLTGDFVELKDGNVAIKLPDGGIVDVPLDKLSEADQEFVKQESEKKDNPFVIREAEKEENPFVIQEMKPAPKILPENEPTNQSPFGNGMSLEALLAEAEKDNPDALGWLCINYAYGLNGCKVDEVQSAKYCERGAQFADTGSPAAQFCKGVFLLRSGEEPQNVSDAIEWFRKSAEQGFAPAQERLALGLAKGIGVKEDKKAAFEWYQKSALQGFPPAEYGLAVFYNDGIVVEQSEKDATQWLRQAAEHGFTPAQILYAWFLFQGIGDSADVAETIKWLRKAAELGDAEALDIVKRFDESEQEEAEPTQVRSPIQELIDESPEFDERTNSRTFDNANEVKPEPRAQTRPQQSNGSRQINPNNARQGIQRGLQIYNGIRRFL